MKRLDTLKQRAEATIFEHLKDMAMCLFDSRHLFLDAIQEAGWMTVIVVLIATAPISWPPIAWWRRREARHEVERFNMRRQST